MHRRDSSRARRAPLVALAAAALVSAAAPVHAVTTQVWRNATPGEFSAGRLEKAMISSLGVVTSGFDVLRQGVPAGLVWSVAEGVDGTVYVGTGNSGEIFALRGTKLERYAKLDPAVVVTSLVLADTPKGRILYAGTLPEGRIFEVTVGGKTGSARELCKLDAAHIWSLHYDRRGRRLYAGTGPEGKLFAIETSGKNRVAYDSGEKHVLSMAAAPDGAIYLGMAERGIVLRFDPRSGKARAVHDFETDEVRAVVARGETLYVAVNKFDRSRTVPPLTTTFNATRSRPGPIGGARSQNAGHSSSAAPQPRKGKGWVWRIDPDGRTERLLYLSSTYVSALDVDGQGNVYAGTGSKGRVYMVRPDRTIFTAFELRERQVLALSMGRTPVIGTADAGAVYRVLGRLPRSARYASKVFDAGFHSRWGNLMWRGVGTLAFETRSGNTAEPDKTWSPWQKVGTRPPSRVPSPPGRYFQYRVSWEKDANARLREVVLYYLNQNQRPRVTSLSIAPAPAKNKGDDPPAGQLKITWKVDNPDSDTLVHRVYYRAEGEQNWKLLTRPDPLTKAEYVWNTQSVPHGQYRVKVTTSDERSNPPGAALVHERISPPLLVDNGKPQFTDLQVRFPNVSGRARDGQSRISRIEYAIDGGEWVFIYPKDGIFDDQVEPFTIRIGERLAPGQHSLALRAWDAAGNLGAAQVTFTVR